MSEKTKDPVPQGKYVPATRGGSLIFTAGMTPLWNSSLSRKIWPSVMEITLVGI
mgnify:CR=1 FL=1